jgi:hypothetical protein
MITRYIAFLAVNTHRKSELCFLQYEPVSQQSKQAQRLLDFYAKQEHGRKIDQLSQPSLHVCEGRESSLLPPSQKCHGQASFVEQLLQDVQLDDKKLYERLIERAYDLEARQRYVLPRDRPVPATIGALSEDQAFRLVKPDCDFAGATVADRRVAEVTDPEKRFVPWKPGAPFALQLLHLEARQVLLRVESEGPAIVRVSQYAQFDDKKSEELGSFVIPLLD